MNRKSQRKRWYRWWLLLPAFLAAAALLWQLAVMVWELKEQRELQELVILGEEGIPDQVLEQLTNFPGVTEAFSGLELSGQLTLGDYSGPVTLWGVDLETYPFKLVSAAGEVALGDSPALVLGREALSAFEGRDGKNPSQARIAQMEESYPELSSFLQLGIWEESAGAAQPMAPGGNAGAGAGQGTVNQGASGQGATGQGAALSSGTVNQQGRPAVILGLAEGQDCYMDQEQMRRFFREAGESYQVQRVYLRVKGKQEAENLEQAAGEAGLQVSRLGEEE